MKDPDLCLGRRKWRNAKDPTKTDSWLCKLPKGHGGVAHRDRTGSRRWPVAEGMDSYGPANMRGITNPSLEAILGDISDDVEPELEDSDAEAEDEWTWLERYVGKVLLGDPEDVLGQVKYLEEQAASMHSGAELQHRSAERIEKAAERLRRTLG